MIPPVPGFGERVPASTQNPLEGAASGAEGGFGELLDALAHSWGKPGPEVVQLAPAELPPLEPLPLPAADPLESWDERAKAPEASVFNQHGYFASGETNAGDAVPAALSSETISSVDSRFEADAEPVTLRRADAGPGPRVAGPAHGMVRAAGVVGAHAPAVSPSRTAPAQASAATLSGMPVRQILPPSSDPADDAAPASPAGRFVRLLEQRAASPTGAASMIEVVLREVEQGLVVAGRVAALDPRERARLHDEIAGLLARHGLAARAIQISTRSATGPRSQGRT